MKLLGRLIGLLILAFLVFYVAKHPAEAASNARGIGHLLGNVADGFGAFLAHLSK